MKIFLFFLSCNDNEIDITDSFEYELTYVLGENKNIETDNFISVVLKSKRATIDTEYYYTLSSKTPLEIYNSENELIEFDKKYFYKEHKTGDEYNFDINFIYIPKDEETKDLTVIISTDKDQAKEVNIILQSVYEDFNVSMKFDKSINYTKEDIILITLDTDTEREGTQNLKATFDLTNVNGVIANSKEQANRQYTSYKMAKKQRLAKTGVENLKPQKRISNIDIIEGETNLYFKGDKIGENEIIVEVENVDGNIKDSDINIVIGDNGIGLNIDYGTNEILKQDTSLKINIISACKTDLSSLPTIKAKYTSSLDGYLSYNGKEIQEGELFEVDLNTTVDPKDGQYKTTSKAEFTPLQAGSLELSFSYYIDNSSNLTGVINLTSLNIISKNYIYSVSLNENVFYVGNSGTITHNIDNPNSSYTVTTEFIKGSGIIKNTTGNIVNANENISNGDIWSIEYNTVGEIQIKFTIKNSNDIINIHNTAIINIVNNNHIYTISKDDGDKFLNFKNEITHLITEDDNSATYKTSYEILEGSASLYKGLNPILENVKTIVSTNDIWNLEYLSTGTLKIKFKTISSHNISKEFILLIEDIISPSFISNVSYDNTEIVGTNTVFNFDIHKQNPNAETYKLKILSDDTIILTGVQYNKNSDPLTIIPATNFSLKNPIKGQHEFKYSITSSAGYVLDETKTITVSGSDFSVEGSLLSDTILYEKDSRNGGNNNIVKTDIRINIEHNSYPLNYKVELLSNNSVVSTVYQNNINSSTSVPISYDFKTTSNGVKNLKIKVSQGSYSHTSDIVDIDIKDTDFTVNGSSTISELWENETKNNPFVVSGSNTNCSYTKTYSTLDGTYITVASNGNITGKKDGTGKKLRVTLRNNITGAEKSKDFSFTLKAIDDFDFRIEQDGDTYTVLLEGNFNLYSFTYKFESTSPNLGLTGGNIYNSSSSQSVNKFIHNRNDGYTRIKKIYGYDDDDNELYIWDYTYYSKYYFNVAVKNNLGVIKYINNNSIRKKE